LIELVRWECNPTIDYACPGCGAARSGAPLIRDRHGLERSTQVGFTRLAHIGAPISDKTRDRCLQKNRKIQGSDQPARRSRLWKPHPEEARSAVSKDEDGPLHAPSCFETHRSAVRQWKHLHSCRAAMLLSMRAGERCAFWPNEPNDHFAQTKPSVSVRVWPERRTTSRCTE